jgi:asparagine synthase (glutamine-hydrolysing)
MCGIAGFVTIQPNAEPARVLDRMTEAIQHRGPDAFGFYRDEYAALGHRRLSIIDVSAGAQPMYNEDGTRVIVYNGEIFNHAALRPALEAVGHRYVTRCDTETILHSYEQHGPDCVNHFRGMFSFAIWDKKARTLFCARDRLGKKPFYYYWDGRIFVFGSEIKALLEHPAIAARVEHSVLPEYLAFGYLSEERTLFAGIKKLMPGHWLKLTLQPEAGGGGRGPGLQIRQYWEIPEPRDVEARSDRLWITDCRSRMEETVRMRLMSDVPLGMFLSGGVDSSAIAAIIKRQATGPVKTFSVGYGEAAYSELEYAQYVAKSIGTEHHEVVVGMEEFFNALPMLVWHEDEPITWPSSVSLYFVSKLAAEQVKVVLTGEGSDELFAGYGRYHFYEVNQRWARYYRVLPAALRRAMRAYVASSGLLSAGLRRKLQHTFVGRGDDLESLYLDNFYCAFGHDELPLKSNTGRNACATANFRSYWDERPEDSPLARMLYADQKTYLVELLMKQDQMSMACSIESRVPFLDHLFVEFAATVPENLKIRNGVGKYIVKKAVEDLIPREIIYRKKMGFPTPLRQWLLEERSAPLLKMLERRGGIITEYLDAPAVSGLLERHRAGKIDATDRIWRLLTLQLWGDLYFTGRREEIWEGLLRPQAVRAGQEAYPR